MKFRKVKLWMLAAAITMTTAFPMSVFAGAADDGATDAKTTVQAANGAYTAWEKEWNASVKNDWTQISLTPGSDATQLNFSWYSKVSEAAPKLAVADNADMKDAKEYTAAQTDAVKDSKNNAYKSNRVTVTGLKENTTYYYAYEKNGKYTEPVKYTTKDTDSFSFIYVGDPQIGSSNPLKGEDTAEFYNAQSEAVCNDTFNWDATLMEAQKKTNYNASFVLSAGDQIQTTKKKSPNKAEWVSEIEYAGYLSPDVLASLPVATTVGNHDADNENYTYHFNTPNNSELGSNGIVGGDYWFTYGDALFLMLNTQDTNVAEHKQFIEQAIAANPDCTWRIVTLHQDIYGSAEHSNEPEITNLRYSLVPYFEENDIDVVLTGHDHAYSRSKILAGGTKTTEYTDDEFDEQLDKDLDVSGMTQLANPFTVAPANIKDDTTDPLEKAYISYLTQVMDKNAVQTEDVLSGATVNPTGILYMTANSSSGSKFYDLVPRKQSYIAARWQEDVPTYSVVDMTKDTFTINTYRTDNNQKIDTAYTIKKLDEKQVAKKKLAQAKVTVTSLKSAKSGKATLKFKQSTVSVDGYAVAYSTSAKFTAKTTKTLSTKKTSVSLSKLKKGQKLYVKVRPYKVVNGKRVYGAYSKVAAVKVSK